MVETENVAVIPYREEVIVEILGTDERGEPEPITYQFGYSEDQQALVPKQSIDHEHVSAVENALEAEGYHWSS